jgi:hypothetical protein
VIDGCEPGVVLGTKNDEVTFKESRFKIIQSTSNTNVQNGGKLINLQKLKKPYHKFAKI